MGIVDTAYAAMETVRQSFVEIRNLAITASDMPQPGLRDVIKPTFSLDPEYAKSDVYKIDVRILQDQTRACPLDGNGWVNGCRRLTSLNCGSHLKSCR